jgi:predicted aspartyl protease/Tfp pilus assembly protein PilF
MQFSLNGMRKSFRYLLQIFFIFLCASFLVVDVSANNEKALNKAQKALRQGEYDRAEKLYREVLERDSLEINARLGLSYALLKKRNLRDAYDQAARAIALDPLSARAHSILGTVILTSGDFRRSIEEFKTALSLKDDDSLAIAGLAMVNYYENRLADCLALLRRASFIDPNEPDFIFYLGQAAARFERYKEAADAYEKFLRIAPKTDSDRRDRIRGLIDFLRYLGARSSLYNIGGDNQTSIKFDMEDNRPTLEVRINDKKEPLRFVLDTGSGMSVISEETARRLGMKPIARGGNARAVGGGGKFEIVYGFIDSLKIGDVRVENLPVYIRKFYSSGKPADGYLGIAAISSFIATVDYKARTFSLIRRRDAETVQQALRKPQQQDQNVQPVLAIPTRMTSSGFVSGEVKLEGIEETMNFIIDTGASISVISDAVAKREELSEYILKEKIKLYGAAGVAENVSMYQLPKITLGPHSREKVRAVAADLDTINETTGFEQNGILGTNFLIHYRVTFDFRGGIVILEPNTKSTGDINSNGSETITGT